MVIKASLSRQIDSLVEDLGSERQAVLESAIARLTVIGSRAVGRLTELLGSAAAAPAARVSVLRALEAIGDQRALDAALRAVDDADAGVALAAARVARLFVRGPRGAAVVDRLTGVALDRARSEPVRLAAVHALCDLESSTIRPLLEALKDEPSGALRTLISRPAPSFAGSARNLEHDLLQAAEGELPDDPVAIRRAIGQRGRTVALAVIHRLVERIREREAEEVGSRRTEWMAARAAAHAILAGRGSRLALYDVRETLETATGPLPVEFLTALSAVGDASCLEPIAAALARTAGSGTREEWWHRHLASTFQAILERERITRRHRVVQKIERRWKDALRELWPRRP